MNATDHEIVKYANHIQPPPPPPCNCVHESIMVNSIKCAYLLARRDTVRKV